MIFVSGGSFAVAILAAAVTLPLYGVYALAVRTGGGPVPELRYSVYACVSVLALATITAITSGLFGLLVSRPDR
jgi:hypothetical protein